MNCSCGEQAKARRIDTEGKTLVQVLAEPNKIMCEEFSEDFEGISLDHTSRGELMWDETRGPWVLCYPVTGCEGHYIHLDVSRTKYASAESNDDWETLMRRTDHIGLDPSELSVVHIATSKTFSGWEVAWRMAARIGYLLDA